MTSRFVTARLHGLTPTEQTIHLQNQFVRRVGWNEQGSQFPSIYDELNTNPHAFRGRTHQEIVRAVQAHIAPEAVFFRKSESAVGKGVSKNHPILGVFALADIMRLDQEIVDHLLTQAAINGFCPMALTTAQSLEGGRVLICANQSLANLGGAWDELPKSMRAYHEQARSAAEQLGFSDFETWGGIIIHGYRTRIAALMHDLGMDQKAAETSLDDLHADLAKTVSASTGAAVEWAKQAAAVDYWGYGKNLRSALESLVGLGSPAQATDAAQLTRRLLKG